MADSKQAIELVLENEKGYVNDPADPGGETNWGISRRSYPHLDIKSLTREDAGVIYFRDFWVPGNFTTLQSQAVANKVFDIAVNQGISTAIQVLQRALGGFVAGPIVADGNLGQFTARCAAQVPDEKLLPELRARFSERHCRICLVNPEEERFLLGWLRRDAQ